MTVLARDFDQLRLPVRSRAHRLNPENDDMRAVLARRVAAMPGGGAGICSVGSDAVSVCGLDPAIRHQVLSRGWGKLRGREVLLHLPRDEQELEICWKILCYANRAETHTDDPQLTARVLPRLRVHPRFSRTTLQ